LLIIDGHSIDEERDTFMSRQHIIAALLAAALCVPIQACSVGMAMSGSENPDLGAIRVGASRGEVELHLGSPIKTTPLPDGRRADVYQYEIGNEPSAGRAVGHGVMDVLTLGLWEVVGTPIEAVQGETYHATITCDAGDKVADIRTGQVSANM
jgi:hypothetical protein